MEAILKLPTSLRKVFAEARLPTTSVARQRSAEVDGDEDAIALLPDEEKDEDLSSKSPANLLNGRTRKTGILIALIAIGLLAAALLLPSRLNAGTHGSDYYFHIFLPTTEAYSTDFCKTLLSAAVLELPTPWMIDWNPNGDATGDPTVLRMRAVTQWLEHMPPERGDDPVAIIGNPNAWFQVRADVLLSRYERIRRRGDRRIGEMFSETGKGMQGLETKIVFASEKDCQMTEEDSGCLAAAAEDGSLHYLTTNVVMGSLKDIRELWQHATQQAEHLASINSTIDESPTFARIFDDQESNRASLLQSGSKPHGQDFGIMLDFGRELSYAADDKLQGVAWIKHNNQDPHNLTVPEDIALSAPPFSASPSLPNATWSDIPLLTGIAANIVPALVQQGPKAAPEVSSTCWEKMWFQPYGRQLLDAYALSSSEPLAVVVDGEGKERRYWSPHVDKIGVVDLEGVFRGWEGVCAGGEDGKEVAESVFGDGRGDWVDPRS